MLCAISGEAPQVPVASRKSGTVFEKRLIESYISEHGTDPSTGEDLTTDDLIDLKTARTVRPRPPTLTSIPSLLSTFQNEWDALALETYTLKQQLAQTRQELSTALYQQDAAVRVIARLSRERDEARDALGKIEISAARGGGGTGVNGDAEMLDGGEVPEEVKQRIDEAQKQLSSTRRKRPVPEEWATADDISLFDAKITTDEDFGGSKIIRTDASGDLVLLGGPDGAAGIYSLSQKRRVKTFEVSKGSVVDAIWWDGQAICGLSTGAIKIFKDDGTSTDLGTHSGSVAALSLHPCGDILSSVGQDKGYMLYDLQLMKLVNRVYIESEPICGHFHPDGHLFAAGCVDGEIKLFDPKSGDSLASFNCHGPIKSISFSENGTWLAVAVQGSSTVQIWDLRKASIITELEIGSAVSNVRWDYTGQYLATVGVGGITVQQYQKSSKSWSEPLKKGLSGIDASWGPNAKSLVVLTEAGSLQVFGGQ